VSDGMIELMISLTFNGPLFLMLTPNEFTNLYSNANYANKPLYDPKAASPNVYIFFSPCAPPASSYYVLT